MTGPNGEERRRASRISDEELKELRQLLEERRRMQWLGKTTLRAAMWVTGILVALQTFGDQLRSVWQFIARGLGK